MCVVALLPRQMSYICSDLLVEVVGLVTLILPETVLVSCQVWPNAKLPSEQDSFVKISVGKVS